MRKIKHLPTLDGLRAISILLVLAAHLLPLGAKDWHLNDVAATSGLALFFVLSGFLITETLLCGQSVKEFLRRRAARILPLAYAYLIFVAILTTPPIATLFANLFFLENYTYSWMLNGHFWSLCVEVHFYLTIAVVAAIGGPQLIKVAIPILCVLVTAMRVWHGAVIDIQTHLRVDEICAGSIVAIIYLEGWFPKKKTSQWVLLTAFATLAFCSHSSAGAAQYLRPYCSGAILIATISLEEGIFKSILISRLMAYIAKISYALYVIHPITAYGYMNEGSLAVKYLVKRPISFLASFALAHISTFYYEARWIDLAKKASAQTKPAS